MKTSRLAVSFATLLLLVLETAEAGTMQNQVIWNKQELLQEKESLGHKVASFIGRTKNGEWKP